MRHCIDNLVAAGEDVEVIIVNDGSKDDTGKIADEYEKKYPTIVKAIQKENGGHGSGVMAGIRNATGMFFKVVDSDDWIETKDVLDMLDLIKRHEAQEANVDLYITNYVYEHAADNSQYVMHYRKCLPPEQIFAWEDMKRVKLETVFLMHSLLYRTSKLRESKMDLPNHTFYVDDIYAYQPLPFMKKIFYHDIDLYHYFIGRADQSVNYGTMCKRYELIKQPKHLKKYMFKWLMTICGITIMTIVGTKEDKKKRWKVFHEYFDELKGLDKKLYNKIRHRSLACFAFNLPGYSLKSFASKNGYKVFQKRLKLG